MSFITRLLHWWRPDSDEEAGVELTIENCGLAKEQIRLARFTLKALGLKSQTLSLTIDDLVFLCYSVGMNPPEYVIEAKLRTLGLSPKMPYTFEHFLHLWSALLENQDDEEVILERAFNFFDKDGNGEISTSEFKATMTELGNLLSEAEIDEFLGLMDTNHDGVIDYAEFIRLLKCQRPIYMELATKSSEDYEASTDKEVHSTDLEIRSFPSAGGHNRKHRQFSSEGESSKLQSPEIQREESV